MNDDSRNILELVKELRKVFEQISALLSAAEGLLGENGWESVGSGCIRDSSAAISVPQRWIPYDIYRFYSNGEIPNKLIFIAVLLDDAGWGESEQKEALITAGCFDYGDDEVGENWEYWWRRWHDYMPQNNDGSNCEAETATQWPEEEYPFKKVTTFALPLTLISNIEELTDKIINPLLEIVGD